MGCKAHRNFADESVCLLAENVQNVGAIHRSHTGDVESGVCLNIDVPGTSGRGSDIPFEAVLQRYLQFLYEYF
jgi:hypothetical protein